MTLNRIADGQPVRAHDYPWLAFILPSEVLTLYGVWGRGDCAHTFYGYLSMIKGIWNFVTFPISL